MSQRVDEEELEAAASALKRGELVIFPTETVYGLGADARNDAAVSRIYALKRRPQQDPIIAHLAANQGGDALDQALDEGLCFAASDRQHALARQLAAALWPGPLTLVLPIGPRLSQQLSGGTGHVGLRAPAHPLAQALLARAALPVAAPSANRYAHISPTSLSAARRSLGPGAAALAGLDGGACTVGIESTVVAVESSGELRVLRHGSIGPRALELAAGASCVAPKAEAARAPGQAAKHYAPGVRCFGLSAELLRRAEPTPGRLRRASEAVTPGERVTLLLMAPIAGAKTQALSSALGGVALRPIVLGGRQQEHLEAAAQSLYAELASAEARGDVVLCELPAPEDDAPALKTALRDRISRACWSGIID